MLIIARTVNVDEPHFHARRRDAYRELRKEMPVARLILNGNPAVLLTRYEDVDNLLRSTNGVVLPKPGCVPDHAGDGPAARFYKLSLPMIDPPLHTRLRAVVMPLLGTPKAVAGMTGWVGGIIDQRLSDISGEGGVEVVSAFGDTIPVDVACRLFDVPREDGDMLAALVADAMLVLDSGNITPDQLAKADHAATTFFDYFGKVMAHARKNPKDGFVSALVEAVDAGEMEDEEALTTLIDVFMGSYHTTMVSFTNAIRALALHPEVQARLKADPTLSPRVWEEVLRFDPPVHFRNRYVREPITIAGEKIEPGTLILLGLASGNWDENVFENPDKFDIDRKRGKHLAFGAGGHFCLGAHLSRLEGALFLPKLLDRFPEFSIDEPDPLRIPSLCFPSITEMPIRF